MNMQEIVWDRHYNEVMEFMRVNKRRPSKHRVEDHRMLNWIKYNKKMIAKGALPEHRVEKFNRLLALADKYRRYNSRTYVTPIESARTKDLFEG